jgi:trehalose-6-phosphate synthase
VEGLVARINHTFGRPDWTPVEYFYGTVDLNTLASLYRAADVMVVTALRDGMNLVAKEFIATRADGDGVLILSRFAGAAEELQTALQVNPNHVGDLAHAYQRALTMPRSERRRRMRELRQVVEANDVVQWATDILEGLPSPDDGPLGEAPGAVAVAAGAHADGSHDGEMRRPRRRVRYAP